MASYESEHARDEPRPDSGSHRPDFSSLYALLHEIRPDENRTREHAVPIPGDMSAAYRHLADAFRSMQQENENESSTELLQTLISSLLTTAEHPPTDLKGVDEEYIANLERVPIKKMKSDADCPICGNEFKDDPHPLLVRLPCHDSHVFDLECIRPWLLLNGTCPLDRVDLAKKEKERKQKIADEIKKNARPEDDEEEWDGLYG